MDVDDPDGCARAAEDRSAELWTMLCHHRPRLVALGRGFGLGHHDAEDIASEALLRAATYQESLDWERLARFLTAVTRRICIDELRRTHRQALLPHRVGRLPHAPSPEDRILHRAALADLIGRARLTATEATVVAMTAAGYRHLEIARMLTLTTAHASELALSRARRKVRRPQPTG